MPLANGSATAAESAGCSSPVITGREWERTDTVGHQLQRDRMGTSALRPLQGRATTVQPVGTNGYIGA